MRRVRFSVDGGPALDGILEGDTVIAGAVRHPLASVRLLAPFDPVVWDRRRFELLWGWAYRFEAYTPVAKRKLGYYALPLLWRDRVIGWANVSVKDGRLQEDIGYVTGRAPKEKAYKRELEAELEGFKVFMGFRRLGG